MAKNSTPEKSNPISLWFTQFARAVSRISGRPSAFLIALAIVFIWAITGPVFGFSDTWQLVINTGTTIVTFLMVFLIQNAQNRDTESLQLKLDELIRAVKEADNKIIDLEELDDQEMEALRQDYLNLARSAQATLSRHRKKKPAEKK
jgi:low affinity Fe/Cu permease